MKIKAYRFPIIYIVIIIISIFLGWQVDKHGINVGLKNYYDFVGDILNFTAILTGFIGAIISILTSISKSSPIITSILKSKKALSQFVVSMAIPFTTGLITIFLSMMLRLKIHNTELFLSFRCLNATLLSLVIFFVLTSFIMTFFVFYIFFLDGFNVDPSNTQKVIKPTLKK